MANCAVTRAVSCKSSKLQEQSLHDSGTTKNVLKGRTTRVKEEKKPQASKKED